MAVLRAANLLAARYHATLRIVHAAAGEADEPVTGGAGPAADERA
ncbi:MAG: hypothetical protein SFV51_25485 [Bryobacteraceae bacterium]|nr:hypothetical protein [Bryobacteraceae bacterium]